jgi:hypothetical protein
MILWKITKGLAFLAKNKGDLENFEIPVWQNIGTRWYEKLNRLARKYGVTRADLLDEALGLFEKYRKTMAITKAGGKAATEEDIRKVFGGYAKSWWESLTPEQRAAEAKKRSKAAKVRWAKKK